MTTSSKLELEPKVENDITFFAFIILESKKLEGKRDEQEKKRDEEEDFVFKFEILIFTFFHFRLYKHSRVWLSSLKLLTYHSVGPRKPLTSSQPSPHRPPFANTLFFFRLNYLFGPLTI